MNTAVISFDLDTTNPDAALGFEVWIDDALIENIDHVSGLSKLEYNLDNNKAQHQLKLVLKNKTWEHTNVDNNGNILQDACLTVENLKFDGIELGHLFVEQAEYHHQNNNPGNEIKIHKFYGMMGCNGEVILNFSTPIYLWMLENM